MGEGGETDQKDRRGNTAMDYSRGRMVRFVLARFHGRAPKLDAIVRSHREEDLVKLLQEAPDSAAPKKTKEIYQRYAKYRDAGTLASRAATLAQRLTKKDTSKAEHDSDLHRLAIARFLWRAVMHLLQLRQ